MIDPLKEKIQSLCPDVMELKHGCYFKWNFDTWFINCEQCPKEKIFGYSCSGDMHSWPPEMGEGPHYRYKYRTFDREKFDEEKEYFEILGSPITLAIVLRAIQKHLGLPNDALPFHTAQLLIHWNLLKDYDDQDEPTKAFIRSLLGV